MSADKTLEVQAKTDNGTVHSMFMAWAGMVREQPAVRITREELIASWEQDPQMAGHVARLKREVPKGALMFITDAGSGKTEEGPVVTMTVRYG